MIREKKLNVDVPKAVSDLEDAMKDLRLRTKIYRMVFRGRGLEFDSFRDYGPDEDANEIDWKASKRANKLLVKRYIEERDLKIVIVLDVGESMVFGSSEKLKCEYAAEVVAALSHLIMKSNDNVGLVLYSWEIKEYIPPSKGEDHFHILADKVSDSSVYGGISRTRKVMDFLLDYLDSSVTGVIFVSDFLGVRRNLIDDVRLVSSRFESVALVIRDPLDMKLPDVSGEIVVEDPITRQQVLVNPKIVGKIYEKHALDQMNVIRDVFMKTDVDFLELSTDKPFVAKLSTFLAERLERKKTF
jgi:uncharacterized protein (DUF58 family)